MSCNIVLLPEFERHLKKLIKRYKSMKQDYIDLLHSLQQDPSQGTDLGRGLRKIRISITSKGKGKRGDARVISLVAVISVEDTNVVLLDIYDKSDKDSISDRELTEILKRNGLL